MRHLITCMLLTLATVAFSQNPIQEGQVVQAATIEFNGGKYNGYLMEYSATQNMVEDAIKERFKSQGLKPAVTKGYLVYRNVVIPAIDPGKKLDAFIKVERKSRKEKEQTTVFFITAIPGEIPEEKVKSDVTARNSEVENSGAFLTSILPDVKQSMYDKGIADQETLVKKEEKKLSNLVNDQADIEKKIKKFQNDLENIKKDRERQATEVEKAKNDLNELVLKNPKRGQ